jgi:elongation factor Ts
MDCKRALDETNSNHEEAERLLKQWGLATAAKKGDREARQGMVESYIHAGGRVGAMVEVNCETDFVARTEDFRELAHDIAMQVAAMNPTRVSSADPERDGAGDNTPLLEQAYIKDPGKTIQDLVNERIARLRENIVVRRFSRFELGGE